MDKAYLVDFLKSAAVTSAWLIPIVLALVTYWGKLGVAGKWQLVSSMATGLVLGGLVMYAQEVPTNLIQWLAIGIYGLVLGLTASGVYETGKEIVAKV